MLLADEPTGNLDRKTSDEIHSLLYSIQQNTGISLVIVTHSEELAGGMGRRVRLVDGHIVETGLESVEPEEDLTA